MFLNILYLLALLLASPWLIFRALTTGRYREGWGEKALGRVPILPDNPDAPTLWLHAVSVGEVNLLPMLVSRLEQAIPGVRCVISTTTKTGMEVARKRFPNHTVFYYPLDFTWAVKTALKRIRPTALILAELEVWPNMTRLAKKNGVKVVVFNGRISDKSFPSYRRFSCFLRPAFQRVDKVVSQSDVYSQRFIELGVPADRVVTVGSIKFDGAKTDRAIPAVARVRSLTGTSKTGAFWEGVTDADVVFLAGSTQDPEEEMALNVFNRFSEQFDSLKLILVPRHPERFDTVAKMLESRSAEFIRRTELTEQGGENADGSKRCRILLVDTVGELGAWWGTTQIAFVGGSMGSRGGQNMIEPAGYGATVSFGPNTTNFRDVVALLLGANAAVVVKDEQEMLHFVEKCLTDPAWREELGARARELVLSQTGAADKTVGIIKESCELRVASCEKNS
ncbi:MAG: 3-deoxy-D-manno-octulosonic acid transferase [Thermoguttaceae bacterium]|nr:3-deoxy-D-manno-octulosonic acid transferase [Thermoguttaceae bacterium]